MTASTMWGFSQSGVCVWNNNHCLAVCAFCSDQIKTGFSFTIQSFNPTFYAICVCVCVFFTTHSIVVFYYSIQNVKMIS